jgi:hypothetical protein
MFADVDPLTGSAGELLGALVDDEPGLMLMSALLMVDRSVLAAECAVTWVQVHERIGSWWASRQVDALIAGASPQARVAEFWVLVAGSDEEKLIRLADVAREELSAATRQSPATARSSSSMRAGCRDGGCATSTRPRNGEAGGPGDRRRR